MKNQIKKFGFVIIGILCFLAFFNYCNKNNNKPNELQDAGNLTKILEGHKETFKSQWEEVKRNYPLVALAFTMQEVVIYEQMDSGTLVSSEVTNAYTAFTGRSLAARSEGIRINQCIRNLLKEAGRAEDYQAVSAAFDKFQNCIRREN